MVMEKGSETLVSCFEVQMGLVLLSSARCWAGVYGPVHWHCSLVTGPGQAEGLLFAAGIVS